MSRPSPARPGEMRDTRRHSRGQTLAEFGITLPLLMAVILGIFQVSYLIYQQYVAVNLARVGANLILRKSPFDAAAAAIRLADPQFDADTRLILSVVQLGTAPGPNKGNAIIVQRHAWGMSRGASALGDPPSGSYDPDQDYAAMHLDSDTSIQAKSPLPNGLQINQGQSVYVAEIYRKRRDIVPLTGVPDSLYSAMYF